MLSITTKYAVKALQYLEGCSDDIYVPIEALAESTGIPRPYLAKIMKTLSARGLVDSKKGLNGGVRLKGSKNLLSLYDVARCLDDPILQLNCFLEKKECRSGYNCAFHSDWSELKQRLLRFLKETKVHPKGRKGTLVHKD